jgi:tetratricopeptide (TPR) repeat protein
MTDGGSLSARRAVAAAVVGVVLLPIAVDAIASLSERRAAAEWRAAQLEVARRASARGDDALAAHVLGGARLRFPDDPDVRAAHQEALSRAILLGSAPGPDADLLALQSALETATTDDAAPAGARAAIGRLEGLRGRSDEAFRAFGEALARDPGLARARLFIGELHFERAEFEGAADALTRALELDPTLPGAKRLLGRALLALSRHSTAEPYLEAACREQPDDGGAWFDYARALSGQKRWAEAEAALIRTVERPPVPRGAHGLLGDALLENRKVDAALQAWRTAFETDGDLAAFRKLGRALGQLGDVDGAVRVFTEIARRAPEDPEPHLALGLAAASSGASRAAREHLGRCVSLAAGHTNGPLVGPQCAARLEALGPR